MNEKRNGRREMRDNVFFQFKPEKTEAKKSHLGMENIGFIAVRRKRGDAQGIGHTDNHPFGLPSSAKGVIDVTD